MERKFNVLVVEDDRFIIENLYKDYLSSLDAEIDFAESKREAIEKARCKTYNIAFVDIMLKEDVHDRGGIDVIEYIHKLNEGTAIIVVSGTNDIRVPLATYKVGIADFIQKENIHTEKDLLYPVQKILDNYEYYKCSVFGRFTTLSAYLASPELTPFWEDTIRNVLNVSHETMISTFNIALQAFLPILRREAARHTLTTNSESQSVSGAFWSKGVGCPIWFSAANQNGKLVEPSKGQKGDTLYELHKKNLMVAIWKMVNVKREEFRDSMWDETE